MSFTASIAAHLNRAVPRKTAFVVFAGSAAVLLGALLIGAGLLVALVFFYGFPQQAFFDRATSDEIAQLKLAGIVLGAVGALSFITFIQGCCMLAGSIAGARYRGVYLWFVIVSLVLAALAGGQLSLS